jgi:polynucleotide 5'-hydroxyl-kinase GRC3/NOL9
MVEDRECGAYAGVGGWIASTVMVMSDGTEEILPAWEELEFTRLSGIVMVVGASDVGKSTFARYLFRRLCGSSVGVAYLDGDPGQSSLGPPTTMTVALARQGEETFPPRGPVWRGFVGSVSPAGHMLPVLIVAARLTGAARKAGTQVIIYDTTGLVDPSRGGIALKLAKIDLLRPSVLVAIQRDRELEPLLAPLRRSRRVQIMEFPCSRAARFRERDERQANRSERFAGYFNNASSLSIYWAQFAVFPAPRFYLHRLVSLEDESGHALALGIVTEIDRLSRRVGLLTPLASLSGVDAIRLGDLVVDPETFRDQPLSLGDRDQQSAGANRV